MPTALFAVTIKATRVNELMIERKQNLDLMFYVIYLEVTPTLHDGVEVHGIVKEVKHEVTVTHGVAEVMHGVTHDPVEVTHGVVEVVEVLTEPPDASPTQAPQAPSTGHPLF